MKTGYTDYIKLKPYQDGVFNETMDSLAKTGQGAISLFTGGGKSFIGLKIALTYLENNPNKSVLWLGTNSANQNVYSSVISKLPYQIRSRIRMKTYDSMYRGDFTMPITEESTCLMIMDESHRALTKNSMSAMLSVRDTYKCDKVAMSATHRRTDGKASFNILVPNAIWSNYDCTWASKRRVINKINYLVANTRISSFDLSEFERYKKMGEIYDDLRDECNRIEAMLNSYKFDFTQDIYSAVKNSGMSLDASNGVRHVVFFNTIDSMMTHEGAIIKAFKMLYPSSVIRTFEYYSKMSKYDENTVLSHAVNSEPIQNTVDIIFTVNKGSESIHPRGIRSVMMLRNTSSYIKFTQQMGRGITLRDFANGESYIFDFSDGGVSLLRHYTITVGRRDVSNRVADIELDTLESMASKLQKALSTDINIQPIFATDKLETLSRLLNNLRDEVMNKRKVTFIQRVISDVAKAYPVEWYSMPSLENLRHLYKTGLDSRKIHFNRPPYTDSKLGISQDVYNWFMMVSRMIINDTYDKEADSYPKLVSMGHTLYMISSITEDEQHMHMIDYAVESLNRLDRQGKELKPTMKVYKELMQLRALNFHDKLSVNVCTYARHKGLDLSADNISLDEVKKITLPEDTDAYESYMSEIKAAERFRDILNGGEYNRDKVGRHISNMDDTSDTELAWAEFMAWHIINGINFKTAYANFIRHKIIVNYDKELNHSTLSPKVFDSCKRLVTILNTAKNNSKVFNGEWQEYIFRHVDFKNLSAIEIMILRIYGIKTHSKYHTLIDMTDWMQNYNKAKTGDTSALIQMSRINSDKLDPYRQKLLGSRAFKSAKSKAYSEIAPQIVARKIKALYMPNEKDEKEISNAIKDGVITSQQVIEAVFPEYLAQDIKFLMELARDKFDNMIDSGVWRIDNHFKKICISATSSSSCIKQILKNVISIEGLELEDLRRACMILAKISEYKA